MTKLRRFILTFFLGGLVVILPIVILFKIAIWLFNFLITTVKPITQLMVDQLNIELFTAQLLTVFSVFVLCFLLGLLVRTQAGRWAHLFFERKVLGRIPGYSTIKDIIDQFTGKQQRIFSQVVRLSLGAEGPEVTGFITDEYGENNITVFVPTGPNPTTGLILHTTRNKITPLAISTEAAMKTTIGCGAGSRALFSDGHQTTSKPNLN